MKLKAIFFPFVVLFPVVIIAAGIFLVHGLVAHSAPESIEWSQSAGDGTVFPACGSAQSTETCVNGTAQETVSWDVSLYKETCSNAYLYLNGGLVYTGDCSGTYTFTGLNSNQSYSCDVTERGVNGTTEDHDCSFTTNNCSKTTTTPPPSPQLCPNGSAAPNNDSTQCTCAQGNTSVCPVTPPTPPTPICPSGYSAGPNGTCVRTLCPDNVTPAPNGDPAQCTCAEGNSNTCVSINICPDRSPAPNGDPSQCSCAQGNTSACTTTCPDNVTPAPNGDPAQCTCAEGNSNVCTQICPGGSPAPDNNLALCPQTCSDGSPAPDNNPSLCQNTILCPDNVTPAPNGDTNQCTCAEGNTNACTSGGACPVGDVGTYPYCTGTGGPTSPPNACPAGYSGTYPDCNPKPGAPIACNMYFDPATVYPGDSSTLHWDADSGGTLYDVYGTTPGEPASGNLFGVTTSESTTYSFLSDSGSYCYATLDANDCAANQGNSCVSAPNDCGLTDGTVQCDGSCASPSDSECNAGIDVLQWQVSPVLVQSGEVAQVKWQVSSAALCTVTGSNGDGTGSNATGVWSALTGLQNSSPITSQTIYTLNCSALPHALPSTPVIRTVTVNIAPGFQEQ